MSDKTNAVYKIRLQPVDKFFFGGEKSVSENSQTFYFQTSRNFPQQTSVVGMLRKMLLEEAGLLIREENVRRVKRNLTDQQIAVAGRSSFSVNGSDFGMLSFVSPVLILDKDGDFHHCSKKCESEQKPLKGDSFKCLPNVRVSTKGGAIEQSLQYIHNYKPKTDFVNGFTAIGSHNFLKTSDVFTDLVPQIGINKLNKNRRQINQTEEGFFKQTFQRLKPGFAFGCYATFSEAIFGESAEHWVHLGGERSLFKMTLTLENELPAFLTQTLNADAVKLLCLSDAYLSQEILQKASGVYSPTTFRHFKTSIRTENYDKKPLQSLKYNLVEKGSILIFDELPALSELQDPNFYKIGYNYFINL